MPYQVEQTLRWMAARYRFRLQQSPCMGGDPLALTLARLSGGLSVQESVSESVKWSARGSKLLLPPSPPRHSLISAWGTGACNMGAVYALD